MSAAGPIFVCGPSRSGTAMVRSIINRHADVHIAHETHYFDDLRRRIHDLEHLDDDDKDRCVDYFGALTHRPYGHLGIASEGWLDPDELLDRAKALGGTADDFLEAFCRMSAERHDGTIWGEKTPRHVFRIDTMLEAFPRARVVATVRDPRAVVASYKRWHNQGGLPGESDQRHEEKLAAERRRAQRSYHPLLLSLLWRGQANSARSARVRHGRDRVFIQRYESLVTQPEAAIRELVGWLGLDYSPDMLDVPMHNSSFSKFEADRGVSVEAIDRWVGVLDPGEVEVIQRSCGSLMREFDYEDISTDCGVAEKLHPLVTFPVAAVRAARANNNRSGGIIGYTYRRLNAVVGR